MRPYPGHRVWVARDRIADVWRGFGLLVRGGLVCAVYCRSELNPANADFLIESELVDQIEALLADTLDPGFRRW